MRKHVITIVGILMMAMTQAAFADAQLLAALPAANSVVVSPQALMLNFSEQIRPDASLITVKGPDKQIIKTEPFAISGTNPTEVLLPFGQILHSGIYQVDWQVLSVKGHKKTSGMFQFTVK